ncbi:NAD(P)H-dependent oxidoreductase [Streptomyces sp. NPDC005389]|uniref:NADPH-dependent FMN reductase n=1 Tax=Streptomyces sp. NPDC005389 TaxID=3157040 RepID=UPI0033B81C2F
MGTGSGCHTCRSVAGFDLVDLSECALPLLDEAVPASQAPGRQPHTVRWAQRVGAYDAFIMVTPEYNTDFGGLTHFQPRDLHTMQLHGLVNELLAWAQALRPLRAAPLALHPTA